MRDIDSLRQRELIIVTGKGGVGKSAIAAAIGSWLASVGRKTLVMEVDPRENVHQMLGVPPSGGAIVEAGPSLFLQNLQPRTVLDQVVRERVRIEFLIRKVLASPVYHHFSEGAPGIKQMAVLGHALVLVEGRVPNAPAIDVVVLDAPATGHGVALMEAPRLVSEALGHGPIAGMSSEVAEMMASPSRCGVVVVALAEEMPVNEALELIDGMKLRMNRVPDLVVVNALYPAIPEGDTGGSDSLTSLWRDRRALNERELDRLREFWSGPLLQTPLLPIDRGLELTIALREALTS